MIYLGIGVAVLVGVIAVAVVVGMFMPERYLGHVRASFAKPAAEVWSALADFRRHPMTGRMMKSVEAQADEYGLPVWVEDMGHGEKITVKTVESEEPVRLVRDMASAAVPMSSRWNYTLEETPQGCHVTVDGDTSIRRGTWHVPIFRVMMVLGGGVRKGITIQLDMVGKSLGASPHYE